jgi:hypothetical protein
MSDTSYATGESQRDDADHPPIIRILLAIRGSFLLFVATMGVVMILLGATVLGGQGVIAAMFAIWGVSAVIYASGGVLFLRLIGYR